jgi:hypothetical protein
LSAGLRGMRAILWTECKVNWESQLIASIEWWRDHCSGYGRKMKQFDDRNSQKCVRAEPTSFIDFSRSNQWNRKENISVTRKQQKYWSKEKIFTRGGGIFDIQAN